MMVGFEGTTVCSVCHAIYWRDAYLNILKVTPQIRQLIEQYHIGSILLVAKNLRSAEETTQLIYELQKVAFDAGHPVPLTIGYV